jgi:hypothetical protein
MKKLKPYNFKKQRTNLDESNLLSNQAENMFDRKFDINEGEYLSTSQNISPSR